MPWPWAIGDDPVKGCWVPSNQWELQRTSWGKRILLWWGSIVEAKSWSLSQVFKMWQRYTKILWSMTLAACSLHFFWFEVMLKSDANQTTPKITKLFQKWGIKLHTVDWDVPPNMKHYPKTAARMQWYQACSSLVSSRILNPDLRSVWVWRNQGLVWPPRLDPSECTRHRRLWCSGLLWWRLRVSGQQRGFVVWVVFWIIHHLAWSTGHDITHL